MKYFVLYISSEGLQRSDPFEDRDAALQAAGMLKKVGVPAWVEDQNHNEVKE